MFYVIQLFVKFKIFMVSQTCKLSSIRDLVFVRSSRRSYLHQTRKMIFFYEKKVLADFLFFFRLKYCSFGTALDIWQHIYTNKFWNQGLMETYRYFHIDPG